MYAVWNNRKWDTVFWIVSIMCKQKQHKCKYFREKKLCSNSFTVDCHRSIWLTKTESSAHSEIPFKLTFIFAFRNNLHRKFQKMCLYDTAKNNKAFIFFSVYILAWKCIQRQCRHSDERATVSLATMQKISQVSKFG